MIKRGKRYVLLVYAKDINLRKLLSMGIRYIIENPVLYWEKKCRGYKYNVKRMLKWILEYDGNYKLTNVGAFHKIRDEYDFISDRNLTIVGAFHKTRDAYNFISDSNKESFGAGGVVVTKDCMEGVKARTYYNGGTIIRIFYLIHMDVEDGMLCKNIA